MGIDTAEIITTQVKPPELKPPIRTSYEMRPEHLNMMNSFTDNLLKATGVIEEMSLDEKLKEPEFFKYMVMSALATKALDAATNLPEDVTDGFLDYLTPCRDQIELPYKPTQPDEQLDAKYVWQDRMYWAAQEFVAAAYPELGGQHPASATFKEVIKELRLHEKTQSKYSTYEEKQAATIALSELHQKRKANYDVLKQPEEKNLLDYKRAIGEMRTKYLRTMGQK